MDADAGGTPKSVVVALDSQVDIVIRSAENQEFHLHGFDLEGTGGDPSLTMSLIVNERGEFALETHETKKVILVLRVV